MPSSQWLEFYARHFDTVEINYSFYRLPERDVFERWRDETPPNFTFAVKASRYLTHRKKLKDPEEPVDRLLTRAGGLGNKLGPVLYQLPPRWNVNVERLEHFLSILPQNLRHVLEFRDDRWQIDEVFQILQRRNIAYCIMSAPGLPRVMQATAEFAYIRMHSGGEENESNYDEHQLQWWAEQIRAFLEHSDVYVYFNNDHKGFAIQNALRLIELLS